MNRQILDPSRRKKIRMKRARTMPAAKCPAVLPKDRAPLRMLLLLFCRAEVALWM
ncbi:hypothetical protein AHiyo8_17810 [Arthrobacter sp. Hiyo8]|nr:hypothetical protein AHiyo8_17810 [Arthrobacter sp. Hiyo8]